MNRNTSWRRRVKIVGGSALTVIGLLGTAPGALAATEDAKLIPSDGSASAFFGSSVAASGDTAVIGACGEKFFAGSVYVYVRSGSTWTQQAKLMAPSPAYDDRFGCSSAISGDTIIVGAWGDDAERGSAFVFTRSGATWTLQQHVTAVDADLGDRFGRSVALSGDTAVIGSYLDDDGGMDAGSVYVFTRSGVTWAQEAKFTASDIYRYDWFGYTVALSGNTCVVGSVYDRWEEGSGVTLGSAYVFTRSGTTWSEQQKLVSPVNDDYFFGTAVAAAGDTALITAPSFSPSPGYVYAYTRTGTTWSLQQTLAASDGAAGDNFGISTAVSGDIAVIGAWEDDSRTGSAYVFSKNGATWSEKDKLVASDAAIGNALGFEVAYSGGAAFVGSPESTEAGAYSGSVYIFGLAPDFDGDGVPDDADCNPKSDLSPTVVIDGRDTGVTNTLFDNGCTISDQIAAIAASSRNHGQFVSRVARYLIGLRRQGVITGRESARILLAAAWANIP